MSLPMGNSSMQHSSRDHSSLVQADSWYFDRFSRIYSNDDHNFVTHLITAGAEKEHMLTRLVDMKFFQSCEYHNAGKQFYSAFSRYFRSLSRLECFGYIPAIKIRGLSMSDREKYISPIIETLKPLEVFEKDIALRMGSSRKPLSGEEMDNSFLGSFTGVTGFINFNKEFFDKYVAFCGAFRSHSGFEFVEKLYRTVRDATLYQQALVLRDISEAGK